MPVKIFIAYAHEDEQLLNKLKSHLIPLQRQGLIDVWDDRDISAGTDRAQQIKGHLNAAQIILLLVSSDFMDSDYSDYSSVIEIQRAIERGEPRVIPIILRPVDFEVTPFGKLKALPTNDRPIILWSDLDEAFVNVTKGIRIVVKEITSRPSPPSPLPNNLPDKPPKTKEQRLEEGNILYGFKHYKEALVAYEQALLLDPTFAESWKDKGRTLYRLKRYDEALEAFEQSIRLHPDSADSWKGKGWTFYRLGPNDEACYDKALAAFEQVLLLNPDPHNTWDAWNGRGWTLYRLERYDEALAAFEQALYFDPDSSDSWDGKEMTFKKLQRPQEAQYAKEKARQLKSR